MLPRFHPGSVRVGSRPQWLGSLALRVKSRPRDLVAGMRRPARQGNANQRGWALVLHWARAPPSTMRCAKASSWWECALKRVELQVRDKLQRVLRNNDKSSLHPGSLRLINVPQNNYQTTPKMVARPPMHFNYDLIQHRNLSPWQFMKPITLSHPG